MFKRVTAALWPIVLALAWAAPALAQQYPNKPIRLIVPFAAGGGTDLLGRTLAQKLNEAWGQPVLVDNRAGGGGNIGTDAVAKAPADGYTLLMGYVGNLAINPYLFRSLPYDSVRDFAPVTLAATAPNVFVAHPSLPTKTVKDVVALAKAKPGALNYASAGNGTVGHMVAELFKTVTHVNIVHVPYKGNGAAITDVLGGHVQLMFSAPGAVINHIKSGKLRGIAVASAQRVNGLENVPTFAEAGFPAVEATAWYGVLAPANTPRPIVDKLHSELARILKLPDVKERLATEGYDATSCTPEEFTQLIKTDLAKWQKVVKASGAHVD
jgi:tripartite-type tricarboxylate transporter receptor subunit TctC